MKLAIVIPAHNEEANIRPLVTALLDRYRDILGQIIIVDDVSDDATAVVTDQLAAESTIVTVVHRTAPSGVGRALAVGVAAVRSDSTHILTIDADFVENIDEIERILTPLNEGYDGAMGSRFLREGSLVMYPKGKWLFNRIFHLLANVLLGLDRTDLTNNFKCYRREIWQGITLRSPHFSANAETGLYPVLLGYWIKEVPVRWVQRKVGMGTSSFKLLTVGPAYAKVLWWSVRLRHRLKYCKDHKLL